MFHEIAREVILGQQGDQRQGESRATPNGQLSRAMGSERTEAARKRRQRPGRVRTVELESLDREEQLALIADSDVIIQPHGAGLAWMSAMVGVLRNVGLSGTSFPKTK